MKEFQLCYGIKELPNGSEVIKRKAAKAVIVKENKVLLIITNKGDFKFPGGGYKDGEDYKACLIREMMEETGYQLLSVGRRLGTVLEQSLDQYGESEYFSMMSEYFQVEIDDQVQSEQNLDEYEEKQKFTPVFINIFKAIENNKKVMKKLGIKANPWVKRETDVMMYLEQFGLNER